MYLKVLFLFFYVFVSDAAYEGEPCVKDGVAGVCTNLNRCQSAIADIRNRKNPQSRQGILWRVHHHLRGITDAPDLHNELARLYAPNNYYRNRKHKLFAVPHCRTVARSKSPIPRTLTALNDLLDYNPTSDLFADEWTNILLICSFANTDPIVCCLDNKPAQLPVATTTKRPAVTTTTEYVPPVYDYETVGQTSGQCEPIPPLLTVPKTGQKALDKCIEYQDKYVFPCEKGMALTGELARSNHCHHNADELIIGGTDAAQFEFPHMVMVGYGEKIEDVQWLCGGALISERFILTAGHCIASRELGPITYVLIGALRRSDSSDRSKIYKVKNIIKHPQYTPPMKYNDIALVETENTIKLDQYTVPACLHTGDNVKEEKVLATGWGLTSYGGGTSETLQKVILHKFTTAECMQKYMPVRLMKQGFDAQSQTCYGDKQVSKDTCQGDSGGPIQIKNQKIACMYTVVGVTSFGRACGFVGEPGIYTRVANYVPWIESIVWPN